MRNNITKNKNLISVSEALPLISQKNSKFYNLFKGLSEEEKNFQTFFDFKDSQLVEIICAYYEDLHLSFSSNRENIVEFILNFIYNNLNQNLSLNVIFEGTQIGIKEEVFTLNSIKSEAASPVNLSIIKITQNQISQAPEKNLQNSDHQKFSTYIEQSEKVMEIVGAIRKISNDVVGKTVIQLTGMCFLLLDYIADSPYNQQTYELQTNVGNLKLTIEQNCVHFNLISNLSISHKYKN